MISKEVFDSIISDIRNNNSFLDVEKSDFMSFMCRLYKEYSTKKLEQEIQDLD